MAPRADAVRGVDWTAENFLVEPRAASTGPALVWATLNLLVT